MKYKYNEREYGEAIFNNGLQSDFVRYELVVLVKYLKSLGYKKKETEVFLYDFCEKNIEGFNKVKYYKVIDGAIRDGRKRDNKLIEVKEILLMKNEMEYIDNLEVDHEYKKLLLGFLVKKKISLAINKINNDEATLSNYFGGGKKGFREVFQMSNIKSGYKVDSMITELVKKGIVISVIKGDVVLDYITKIPEGDEVYEVIKDFDNIGWAFDYYKGVKGIKKCDECGDFIKITNIKNTSQRYCDKCSKSKELERKRIWKNKKVDGAQS